MPKGMRNNHFEGWSNGGTYSIFLLSVSQQVVDCRGSSIPLGRRYTERFQRTLNAFNSAGSARKF